VATMAHDAHFDHSLRCAGCSDNPILQRVFGNAAKSCI
jgi:hypothetical protein